MATLLTLSGFAQIGGATTYNFLRLAPSWRTTALGETNITIADFDPTTQLSNPASLNPQMNNWVSFSTVAHPGGINYGNASYVHDFGKRGTYGFGIQYINYGSSPHTDESGNIIGANLKANEINLYGGGSYRFGKIFSVGANLKLIGSWIDPYKSYGLAGDLAAMIDDTAHRIVASIVAKNIGSQLSTYQGTRESLPFDLQAGVAVGFKGFPVRFHVTLHDLHRWNIRYTDSADSATSSLLTDTSQRKNTADPADEFFRHLIVGVEINIKKIVYIDFAYNHQRHQEISQVNRRSVAGLSIGIGVHIKAVDVGIALSPMPLKYTLAQFTLAVHAGAFIRNKKTPKQIAQ
jgi:hypothetical protein